MDLNTARKVLHSIKPTVIDLFNMTANQYIYAGDAGIDLFHQLINCLIADIQNLTIAEVNDVFACVLFKGHGRDKTSDRSFRTISTCPIFAKGLDAYVRILNIEKWNEDQAETQYQGEGRSHELAALLLTEAIQFGMYDAKKNNLCLIFRCKISF